MALMSSMNKNSHQFMGRGHGTGLEEEQFRIIECKNGTVMAIIVSYGGIEFIHAHCRKAMIDRWGVFCSDPFRRTSDSAIRHTWAEPMRKGLFLFCPARLEIVPEQLWMKITG